MAFVREELEDLRRAGLLGPFELRWALEELIGGGVGLPEVLGVVFDFAEPEWLPGLTAEFAREAAENALLEELSRRLGWEPGSGPGPAEGSAPRLRSSYPVPGGDQRRDASVVGSEGVRQRPLRGWP